MWRLTFIVLATAALGSIAGTLFLCLMGDGPGSLGVGGFIGFIFRLSLSTMIATVPETLLLVGLQAILLEQAQSKRVAGFLIVVIGGLVGGLVLGFLSESLSGILIGLLYGSLTAIALLLLQTLPGLSPATIR
jgi:hypothetical protein